MFFLPEAKTVDSRTLTKIPRDFHIICDFGHGRLTGGAEQESRPLLDFAKQAAMLAR